MSDDLNKKMNESIEKAAAGGGFALPTQPVAVSIPAVPAPAAPAGIVSLPDVAAALHPMNFTQAVATTNIKDAFSYDVAFNFSFLGSGQGGARLASSFWNMGYRRVCLFNTAESDFQGLPGEINRHILPLGGAAKDARFAEQAIQGHEEDIWDLLQRSWGDDTDYGLICVGLGGGTGSGTSGTLVQIARRYLESKGKEPRVGVIASIPSFTEGQQVCRNAVVAFQRLLDLKVSPLILIDNSKINKLYRPGMTQLFNVANTTISQLFHVFNQLAAVHSPLITFDRAELAQLLDHGICVFGAASLTSIKSEADISEALRLMLKDNVLAEVDLRTGTKGSCLFVGEQDVMDRLSLDHFEAGFSQMNRTLKSGGSVVHRGVYLGMAKGLQIYAMISDLKPPMETLKKLVKEGSLAKGQLTSGLAQFLGLE